MEAKEIGLPVSEPDKDLEDMIWAAWLDVEEELKERSPFNPIRELMNSAEAGKLLIPVPQLELPINAACPGQMHATVQEVQNASTTKINPVDFSFKTALIESSRMGHASSTRGKILACRNPNLVIQYNLITSFSGWQKET